MKHSNFVAALLQFLILASLLKFTFAIRKSYVVALGAHSYHDDHEHAPLDREKLKKHHHRVLGKVIRSTSRAQRKIHYSYENHLNAFSTHLTEKEVARLAKHPEVISVLESTQTTIETTHSCEFLGLERNGQVAPNSLWEKAKYGENMIIAGVDTGIWPESKSYSDEGMGPIPTKWKGVACDLDAADGPTCNRKLIGARVFDNVYMVQCIEHVRANVTVNASLACIKAKTARDDEYDHGTHTLATAGGSFVPGANILGQANGTAKGMAPRACLVGYKINNKPYDYRQPNGSVASAVNFAEGDKLAAFDDAIGHGADVITMSLSNDRLEYSEDTTAIAAFHAVMRGVVFVAAGANAGPGPETVKNLSPWMISVGASTINRELTTSVVLGNNQSFKGISLYEKEKSLPAGMQYPLITGVEAKLDNATIENAANCTTDALDRQKLKGKILICNEPTEGSLVEASAVVQAAEGVGMIIIGIFPEIKIVIGVGYYESFVPSVGISYSDGEAVLAYKNSTSNPTAYLTPLQTEIVDRGDPLVVDFSARGPNPVEPSILKPDIIAPGFDVLGPSCGGRGILNGTIRVPYFLSIGTSFACPHVAGIVALLKSIHPDWSPAAIKSALMTTATTTQHMSNTEPLFNASMTRMTPFEYGAGHVDPTRAADPGLVYDLTLEDYLNFLCVRGYDERRLKLFHAKPYACPPAPRLLDFNYPAITIPNLDGPITVTRRVKNVGPGGAYNVKVNAPPGIDVAVEPLTLAFGKVGEEQVYKAEFKPVGAKALTYVFGELTWSDGVHFVKIPLSVKH